MFLRESRTLEEDEEQGVQALPIENRKQLSQIGMRRGSKAAIKYRGERTRMQPKRMEEQHEIDRDIVIDNLAAGESSFKNALIMRSIKVLNAAMNVGLFALCWMLFYRGSDNVRMSVILCLLYGVMFVMLGRTYDAFQTGIMQVSEVLYSLTLTSVLAGIMEYFAVTIKRAHFLNPLAMLGLMAIQFLWNFAWSVWANHVYFKLHPPKRTIVIYRDERDLLKLREIKNLSAKFEIIKYIKNPTDFHALREDLDNCEAVFTGGVPATIRNGIAKHCVERNVEGYIIPHVGDVIMAGARHMRMYSVPIMRVVRAIPKPEYLFIKRTIDILVSIIALVILSPIMLITACAIKLYDHGPAFYRQIRLTKDGKEFEILKFRSMIAAAEKDGVARLASEHDDRITPVGRFIRACRIDELPQLINILKGDMSIVGPRPERPQIAKQYEQELPAFALRLQVKAGLTGTAQIYGRYNTTPYDKLQMDLMYINQMNIFEDIKIMFATVKILFMKESTEGVGDRQMTAMGYENSDESTEFEGEVVGK